MKLKITHKSVIVGLSIIVLNACKKDKPLDPVSDSTQKDVVTSLATNVNTATYAQLALNGSNLYDAVVSFCANPDAAGLTNCRNLWKSTRSSWELSEGFLYGPASSENIDPGIDTWPVDFHALENVLASSMTFSEAEINALDDALKGFHPIEYILYGQSGAKTYDQFTTREKEYLTALSLNVKTLTQHLADTWNTGITGNFATYFTSPASTNPYYTTEKQVYLEIVNALIDICDEVANEKISTPFLAQNPSLEESPFALNSLTDFTNNIKSVQNVYLGKFTTDNVGLEDLVKKFDLSLNGQINSKINAAITSLTNISGSFSDAIVNQPVQIQNAMDAINALKDELENGLLPFVQLHVN